MENPEKKLRIIVAAVADLKKLEGILRQLVAPQPPTLLLFDCSESLIDGLAQQLGRECGRTIERIDETTRELAAHRIFVIALDRSRELIRNVTEDKRVSAMIFADVSTTAFRSVLAIAGAQVIAEEPTMEMSEEDRRRLNLAPRCVPFTSFLFDSDTFLSRDN